MDWMVRVDVMNRVAIRVGAVIVLTVRVENIKLVALIVDAVTVEVTFTDCVVRVLPRWVMALTVVIFIVDAVILDATITFAEIVLPIMVEYKIDPIAMVEAVSVEYKSVLP
jgi:hypothetical protein